MNQRSHETIDQSFERQSILPSIIHDLGSKTNNTRSLQTWEHTNDISFIKQIIRIFHDLLWKSSYLPTGIFSIFYGKCIFIIHNKYLLVVKVPMTLVQLELSPPQIPHLSNWSLDPIIPSHPVRTHFPFTQTELLYGLHSVPSVTYGAKRWDILQS